MQRVLVVLLAVFVSGVIETTANGGLFVGPTAGVRVNSGTVGNANEDFEAMFGVESSIGFFGGVNALLPLGDMFRLDATVSYTQRGWANTSKTSAGFFGEIETRSVSRMNYLDVLVALNWYPLTTTKSFQPFVSIGVAPGFFLNGTIDATSSFLGESRSSSSDITSDDAESINLALVPRVGADFKLSSMIFGAFVGYDLGLNNIDNSDNNSPESNPATFKLNGVVIGLRLVFALGSED